MIESIHELPTDFDYTVSGIQQFYKEHYDECRDRAGPYDPSIFYVLMRAAYWFCSDWHGGISCPLYSHLSTSAYKPGPMEENPSDSDAPEDEDARYVYERVERAHGFHVAGHHRDLHQQLSPEGDDR